MKKIFIIIVFIIFVQEVKAQSDIIYPRQLNYNIRHCIITDVKRNIVHYQKKDVYDSVEAVAVRQNRSTIILTYSDSVRLYKNHDYNYYSKLYKKELRDQYIGLGITGVGLCLTVSSIITFNHYNTGNYYEESMTPYFLGLGGLINTGIGVLIMTKSFIKKKEYKKGMEFTDPEIKISLITNNNGVGLVMNF